MTVASGLDPTKRHATFTVLLDSATDLLRLDTGDPYTMEIATKRAWRERMTSRPWRPWLSHKVIRYDATIVRMAGVETPEGPAVEFTLRIDSDEPDVRIERYKGSASETE